MKRFIPLLMLGVLSLSALAEDFAGKKLVCVLFKQERTERNKPEYWQISEPEKNFAGGAPGPVFFVDLEEASLATFTHLSKTLKSNHFKGEIRFSLAFVYTGSFGAGTLSGVNIGVQHVQGERTFASAFVEFPLVLDRHFSLQTISSGGNLDRIKVSCGVVDKT